MGKETSLRKIDASMAKVIQSAAVYSPPPSGSASSGNADTVDGFHAAAVPVPNYLLALNGSGQLPAAVYPGSSAQFVVLATDASLTAERVLTQGAGLTITDAGAGSTVTVALTTPGTLTIATTNAAAGNHTHAITSTSNPGATASLLATDASGLVQLVGVGIGVAPVADRVKINTGYIESPKSIDLLDGQSAQILKAGGVYVSAAYTDTRAAGVHVIQATEQLRLGYDADIYTSFWTDSAGRLRITPTGGHVWVPDSGVTRTPSYASQVTGWAITGAGAADFRYVYTDELHAKAFIADLEQALAGGQIISKSVAILAEDFVLPAAGAAATVTLKDLPSAADMAVFESGDMIRFRQFSRAAGSLTIADAWGVVTNYADGGTAGTQTWTFTRSTGDDAGTASGTIAADAIVLDYGTTGNGYHEVNAIDGLYAVNSPYSQVVSWTTHPRTGKVVRTRLGNLNGITGSVEWGLYAGNGGMADTDQFLILSNVTGFELHNLVYKAFASTAQTVLIDSDGDVKIGSNVGAVATTTLAHFATAQVYNSESMGAGDVMLGDNSATKSNLFWDRDPGALLLRKGTTKKIELDSDGDLFIGTDTAGASGVNIAIFTNAQTYNSESVAAGDMLIGDNSSAKANIFWDASAGVLYFRGGTTAQVYIGTSGALSAGGGAVLIDANGVRITPATADPPAATNILAFQDPADSGAIGKVFAYRGATSADDYVEVGKADRTGALEGSIKVRTSDVLVSRALTIGSPTNIGGQGDLSAASDLIYEGALKHYSTLNSATYTGYAFVPLTTPLTSTSWDGDAYSTQGTATLIDLSAVFSAPAGVKAILARMAVRDSAAWGTNDLYLALGPSDSYWYAAMARTYGGDIWGEQTAVIPCDANGDVYYKILASGASTIDIVIEIYGYFI